MLCLGLFALPASATDHEESTAGGSETQDLEQDLEAPEEPAAETSSGPGIAEISLDVLLLRPIGALSTVVGMGFFVVSAPLVAPSWAFSDTWDVFVATPVDDTFSRPLGEL